MTKKYLQASYRRPDDAIAAIEALARAGIPKRAMELYSRRPVETDPPALPRRSRMSLVAVIAAILTGSACTALVFWAQRDYPIITGGMPITSGWATAVVTFESTMAGCVFGILAMLVWEAGLIVPRGRVPVPQLPDEGVLLQVECGKHYASATEVVSESGAAQIEVVET